MATINKRGNSKILNWSDDQGQHRISLGPISDREAEAIRLAKELELLQGIPLTEGSTRTLRIFKEQYLNWFSTQYPASYYRTEQIIEQHLMPAFGDIPLDEITVFDAERYMGERRQQKAKRDTFVKEIQKLKAIMAKAYEWGIIDKHPLETLRYPASTDSKPPRFYSTAELEALYAASPNHHLWWKLMVNTGLRRSELRQLRWGDIADGQIHVVSRDGERTKSGAWRAIPCNTTTLETLSSLHEVTGKGQYVIPQITRGSISRAFQNCLRRAGDSIADPKGSIHCLRHTFCSHLVMKGVPLRTVQQLAGHATYKTTERYAHLAPSHMRSAIDSIEL